MGSSLSDSGATHSNNSKNESLAYIKEVFDDYKTYGGVENFKGTIAEIGPGDNFGVALSMLADGAGQVDLLDRFYSKRDPAQ